MRHFVTLGLVCTAIACASRPEAPTQEAEPIGPTANLGIEYAHEFSGVVESWGEVAPSSSTLSIWIQDIGATNYVLFQVRANLDTYRFALSSEHIETIIEALDVYKMSARQTDSEQSTAIGWLYRADIKLKRMGQDAKNDRMLINIRREERSEAELSLTFDSWLLSFGPNPKTSAQRSYREVILSTEEASRLRAALDELWKQM